MVWQIKFEEKAKKEFSKLDKQTQVKIRDYLKERITGSDNPGSFGYPLRGNLSGLWKYRIKDYRIVARIIDDQFVVLVVRLGHRAKIYKHLL